MENEFARLNENNASEIYRRIQESENEKEEICYD